MQTHNGDLNHDWIAAFNWPPSCMRNLGSAGFLSRNPSRPPNAQEVLLWEIDAFDSRAGAELRGLGSVPPSRIVGECV
jgi:hypothetical protein